METPGWVFAVVFGAGWLLGYWMGFSRKAEETPIGANTAVNPPAAPNVEISEAVQTLIRQDNLIAAIKQLREETGLGLKEAKDAVETWKRANA